MTYKTLLLPIVAVTMLVTSQKSDAMNFDNKKGLFGAFLGGVAVCLVGQYIWKNMWLKRRRRVHYEIVSSTNPGSTSQTPTSATSTAKKPTFDEVNAMVKQLGSNLFLGSYMGHKAPDERGWKEILKASPLVLDLSNEVIVRTRNDINPYKDCDVVTREINIFKIPKKGRQNAYISFDVDKNLASAVNCGQSERTGAIQTLRTYQKGTL